MPQLLHKIYIHLIFHIRSQIQLLAKATKGLKLLPLQGATAPSHDTQGVASLALGYVLLWAFSPPWPNPKPLFIIAVWWDYISACVFFAACFKLLRSCFALWVKRKDSANRAQNVKLAWTLCRGAAYLMQRYVIIYIKARKSYANLECHSKFA